MAKEKNSSTTDAANTKFGKANFGNGGELHQTAHGDASLTTNQGVPIADNQNTLTIGPRGPQLLEDFILREKITHFDHERIPERVVHARGYAAHGYFESYASHAKLTKASFLAEPEKRTPVFCRFSTVAGSEGSHDTARDVRGFAVKFYTDQGNYDLVGNNIPVFFIQDAIKFPDLIHSVKPESDKGFPQAQSAHDTFWDFVSLNSESMHMLMWVMSDRGIPRSYRMMEGFGVHTFRMITAKRASKFVKFQWRPKLGTFSLIWDEAVKIGGADPDFHRRDLFNAIDKGDFPEWELSVQVFTEEQANEFDFDVLDPTKLIPEELIPLTPLGKMVLDRNVDNFFAETEQVAYCATHVVPGIDFSNDPLLQGRLFSYLDTQLSRLGSPNFHQIPVNKPKCPFGNFQRDGHMQMSSQKGSVANDPNMLDDGRLREDLKRGFQSYAAEESGQKLRIRPESFAEHYSQARLFYRSMTEPEQRHVADAFAFELGKCLQAKIRKRMLGHLGIIDEKLAASVAESLGMNGQADKIKPRVAVMDFDASPMLSQYTKAPKTIAGKKAGILVSPTSDLQLIESIETQARSRDATVELIALKIGSKIGTSGNGLEPDHFLAGAPSSLFDLVVVAPGKAEVDILLEQAAAIDWIHDAYGHLKIIGFVEHASPLFARAGVSTIEERGVFHIDKSELDSFFECAQEHRIWDRELKIR